MLDNGFVAVGWVDAEEGRVVNLDLAFVPCLQKVVVGDYCFVIEIVIVFNITIGIDIGITIAIDIGISCR